MPCDIPLPHPDLVLREEFLEPMGLGVYALAKAIHVTRCRVNEICLCRQGITAATALRLGRFFGVDPPWFVNMESKYDLHVEAERCGRACGDRAAQRGVRLAQSADMHYVRAIEFRPNDLASPRATRRTDDLLRKSRSLSRPRYQRGLSKHILKEVSHDARNRKVVQQPKRLWLHPAR
jgi:antitoxin HigA-1